MTRRRSSEGVGEPMFGEDCWAADQLLFQDSLIRRTARPPARRRRPSATTLRKQDATTDPGPQQEMLPWFEDPSGEPDELLRGDGPRALGAVAPDPVCGDPGSGQLLLGFGEPGGSPDRRPGGRAGRGRPAGRGLPGQGGPAGTGATP